MTTDTTQLEAIGQGWRSATVEDLADTAVFFEGAEVWIWSTGAMRLVAVQEIFRSRLTVGFTQKNGTVRTKTVKVSEVVLPVKGIAHTSAPAWDARPSRIGGTQ
jgi:hypothetical protein